MANLRKAIPENVAGNYYVDSTCINCGVSRHYAPEIFGDTGDYAYVRQQPRTASEESAAQRALLSCPTSSIGMREKLDLTAARKSFPLAMTDSVFLNGFNHRDSYGAHSYFIKSETGNWLVDSPRFVPDLVRKFEALGGVRYIFLTHRDDVCDAHRYARHFAARRIIHRLDADAQPDAEIILDGEAVYRTDSGEIHYTPGHTAGHLVLLWESRYLFTGDHFAWDASRDRFTSFRDACWHSWEMQITSVEKMEPFRDVEWVFPGHGKWARVEKGTFPEIIRQSVQWMRSVK